MAKFERRLSHTSMSTYRRCKFQYKLKYLDNYSPLPSKALITGGTGHAGAGAGYLALADGKSLDESIEIAHDAASLKLAEYEEEAGGGEMSDIWEDIALILDRYFRWADENDDFIAHHIEYEFNLDIDDFTVIGFLDGIVESSNGSMWILEHKFTKQVRTKHIEIDPQISLYMLAARALGFDVRGVLYNVVRTTIRGKAETEPVVRLPVYRNNEALEHIARETVWQMREMRDFHERKGEFAYRNETMDCSWDCGFFPVCLAVNDDGDPAPVLRTIPLKDYSSKEGD